MKLSNILASIVIVCVVAYSAHSPASAQGRGKGGSAKPHAGKGVNAGMKNTRREHSGDLSNSEPIEGRDARNQGREDNDGGDDDGSGQLHPNGAAPVTGVRRRNNIPPVDPANVSDPAGTPKADKGQGHDHGVREHGRGVGRGGGKGKGRGFGKGKGIGKTKLPGVS